MTDLSNSMESNAILNSNKNEEKCHELEMNEMNDELTIVDAISVQTELEQLFNDFNIYNHHIRVFKKLLNLKELKNQYNFFSFNHQRNVNQSTKLTESICCTSSSLSSQNHLLQRSLINRLDDLNSTTLFNSAYVGGALSAMQVHSQLNKIKEQFLESQILVTCLIHNVHSLRKHYCGTALDLVSSSELLANLEKDHSTLKRCKSIFKYQCSKKREQLTKLKNQLKQAHEDWNQLIVREPTISKLSNEELILLNKTKRKQQQRKSIDNQLIANRTSSNPKDTNLDNQVNNQLNNGLEKQLTKENSQDENSLEENSTDSGLSASSASSSDLNQQIILNKNDDDKNKLKLESTSSDGSNCDSAVHSESESADSLQELAAAIYRRKSKLDRLEKECYTFMSRLANRNRTLNDKTDSEPNLVQQLDQQFNGSNPNLILDDEDELDDNFNDYANQYDEDLLDEEYDDDVQFDEIMNDTDDLDLENLMNRFSNVQTAIDTEDELIINQDNLNDSEDNRILNSLVNNLENVVLNDLNQNIDEMNGFLMSNDGIENSTEFENVNNDDQMNRFSVDYLIGESRSINDHSSSSNHSNENMRNANVNINESTIDGSNLFSSNQLNQLDQLIINNESIASNIQQSIDSIDDDLNDDLNTSIIPSTEDTTLAKTGEPINLCRLRRRAVQILASRIRTEKQYYEERENELKQKLENLQSINEELEDRLKQSIRPNKQLILISTAFVFCSLVSYFINTFN